MATCGVTVELSEDLSPKCTSSCESGEVRFHELITKLNDNHSSVGTLLAQNLIEIEILFIFLQLYYTGLGYQQFPELTDLGMMIELEYVSGDLFDCNLVALASGE